MNERELFTSAREKQPGERAAFLDEACAGDAALRQRLEALLAAPDDSSLPGENTVALPRDPAMEEGDFDYLQPPVKPGHLGRLGHYEILAVLGKGGFGTVFKAFDEKLHRMVAIKVLAPELAANGTARQRFIREARAAAAVTHDHVVTIHVVDEDHRPPYLVMQLIDGVTLQQKIERHGPLGLKETLRIGMQMAEGLAGAHQHGLVHRDIKPANVLLENGIERVKITDFGLAKVSDETSVTQSGMVAGTPAYMSPEQANGLALDPRSDLFSLGTVLYVMCTGRQPFRATGTIAVLKRVVEETAHPIRDINPEIPDWLEAIIARLHAKKPEERIQTAREVADTFAERLAELQTPRRIPDDRRAEPRKGPGEATATRPAVRPLTRLGSPKALAVVMGALAITLAVIYWTRQGGEVVPPPEKKPPDNPVAAKDEWVKLFNGKDLDGWNTPDRDKWRVADGILTGKDGPAFLTWSKEVGNFHARIEAKILTPGMAFVNFRNDLARSPIVVQAALAQPRAGTGSLALYERPRPGRLLISSTKQPVDWFTLEILAIGKRVTLKVDGDITAEKVLAEMESQGRFQLNVLEKIAELQIRKIEIKELPPTPANEEPFVVLAVKDQHSESRHATLADAVKAAQSGDTIEIRGDGPFLTDPVALEGKALCLRAAAGRLPVLVANFSEKKGDQWLFLADSALVLEGLDVRSNGRGSGTLTLVKVKRAPLFITHCRLQSMGGAINVVQDQCTLGELRHSLLVGSCHHHYIFAPTFLPGNQGRAVLAGNVLASSPGNQAAVTANFFGPGGIPESFDLLMERNTIALAKAAVAFQLIYKPEPPLPSNGPLRLEARHNVFAGSSVDFVLHQTDGDSLAAKELEAFFQGLVAWKEERNLQRGNLELWQIHKPLAENQLRDWRSFWSLGKTASVPGQPRFVGADLAQRNSTNPDELAAADFRLAEGSSGKGVLFGGKDLGADVDLVGPGAAYERWMQTPDFAQWRQKTDAVMAAARTPAAEVRGAG